MQHAVAALVLCIRHSGHLPFHNASRCMLCAHMAVHVAAAGLGRFLLANANLIAVKRRGFDTLRRLDPSTAPSRGVDTYGHPI